MKGFSVPRNEIPYLCNLDCVLRVNRSGRRLQDD